jgi:hypothetical protein
LSVGNVNHFSGRPASAPVGDYSYVEHLAQLCIRLRLAVKLWNETPLLSIVTSSINCATSGARSLIRRGRSSTRQLNPKKHWRRRGGAAASAIA